MMMLLKETSMVALMVFGFGFVVFFHELGHFLAAKWVGIRVEQFAVGFGQALFAFRKGIGWKVGSTQQEYRRRASEQLAATGVEKDSEGDYSDDQIGQAADTLGLGETEYRLNWIPLGGYVKMLGQDDLKPNAVATDPRAYNRKGVGQRMIVVSAGVIMNIILAAIGFVIVFLIGFSAPPSVVGSVIPNSPAQRAGIKVGDRIVSIDNTPQYEFNRIMLTTALLHEERKVPLVVRRTMPDGSTQEITLQIQPARMKENDPKSFLGIGISPSQSLRGPTTELSEADLKELNDPKSELPGTMAVRPNEEIVAIEGQPVKYNEFYKLSEAVQKSDGKPVNVTVKRKDGSTHEAQVKPNLDSPWGGGPLSIAGMEPRPEVQNLPKGSTAYGKLMPGDIIVAAEIEGPDRDKESNPDVTRVQELANQAGTEGRKLTFTVLRDGKTEKVANLEPTKRIEGKRLLGIGLGMDTMARVSKVMDNSPAKKAGIPEGATIESIDGKPVSNWLEVRSALKTAGSHKLTASTAAIAGSEAGTHEYALELAQVDVDGVQANIQASARLLLEELKEPRKAHGIGEAINWGVVETRDFILQFYVTLTRMFQGRISASNMMGPLGIVTAGAKFAFKGMDWLLWFLAMISANLAVVNFLPIPIVDGGLFTFLVVEKLQGKPISPRTQAVAQIIGFAVIISVFLLVTFQDVRRSFGL